MSSPTRRKWPVKIQRGSASVSIYRSERVKAGRKYEDFRIVYYDGNGKRTFESFSDFDQAERKANTVVATISRGEAKTLTLSADDRLAYLRAVDVLKSVSVALEVAASEYAQAKTILKGGSIIEAARQYARSHGDLEEKLVETVVHEFISLREKRTVHGKPASAAYLHDLKVRLRPLGDAFVRHIHTVVPREIEQYVDGLNLGARSRHNMLRTIRTLFRFAQAKRYYPRDVNPMEGIELAFSHEGEIGIFTPDDMRRLIAAALETFPELTAFLVIGAFAGLRSAEIGRLDWASIRGDYIEVTAAKAKTRSRRLVPIQPNLAAWLKKLRKESGAVVDADAIAHGFGALTAATAGEGRAAVEWKPNGLRHSFITYRLANTKNENLVATEAGNSPQMIHRHYRELATEDTAKKWFEIIP